MDTFELLHQAGLSKKEAAVYASLLDSGQQSIMSLNRSTQINRPALYEVLPRLERKDLVSRVKVRNRFQYVAESPERLLRQFEKRVETETAGLAQLAEQFVAPNSQKPVVKYFDHERALEIIFDDVIHTLPIGGEFYRYSARLDTKHPEFLTTYYAQNRDRRKLERLVITSAQKAHGKKPKLERSVRSIPETFDLFEDNISLLIYGHKTAYIDYGSKTSFVIESEKIARFQQKLFQLLWKQLS